ncbi:DUF1361 domain-containing protein [Terrilactibacillus laevilacticus]|uniref:DUF1361 domain-containing protein n=2 Tax=Terrilactibacillus laevilacticus TaxID=1380157 RepID=A0ABW5PSN8_9BACI
MLLNILLAYIPFELSIWLSRKKRPFIVFALVSVVWLVFYPNAPYLLTDFFHLQDLGMKDVASGQFKMNVYIWFQFFILLLGIFYGLFIGFRSLETMLREWMNRLKINSYVSYFTILLIITLLTSYGIYLGRFVRLHTIYLVTKPIVSIHEMFSVFSSSFFIFISIFTGLQLFVFILYSGLISSENKIK